MKPRLELMESSWENMFEVIRNSKIESTGNFWAAIQHLEYQLEEYKNGNVSK